MTFQPRPRMPVDVLAAQQWMECCDRYTTRSHSIWRTISLEASRRGWYSISHKIYLRCNNVVHAPKLCTCVKSRQGRFAVLSERKAQLIKKIWIYVDSLIDNPNPTVGCNRGPITENHQLATDGIVGHPSWPHCVVYITITYPVSSNNIDHCVIAIQKTSIKKMRTRSDNVRCENLRASKFENTYFPTVVKTAKTSW